MSFQETSQSLRARLHVDAATLSVIIGVVAVTCLVVALVLFDSCSASRDIVVAPSPASDGPSVDETPDAPVGTIGESQGQGEAASAPMATLHIHVGGAVCEPGVYELPPSSRVEDAVSAAGGFSEDALRDALNLARQLTDGEQIIVPSSSAGDGTAVQGNGGGATEPQGNQTSASSGFVGGKVNINRATVDELMTLDGIGEVMADRIVADREANGPFKTIEDLKRVSGIGDKKFASLADSITVG